MIVPTSIMGTWRNRKNRNVDLRVAVVLGLAGVVSAFIGGKISVGMSERTSNILFAIAAAVRRRPHGVTRHRLSPRVQAHRVIAHTVVNLRRAERVGCHAELDRFVRGTAGRPSPAPAAAPLPARS